MKKRVLISGGNGLIGKELSKLLIANNFEVAILTRNPKEEKLIPEFYWNTASMEIDLNAAKYAENVIHLAGENIGSERWTSKRKKEIIDSRVKGTQLLAKLFNESKVIPKVFISASATGIYGSLTSEKIFEESDLAADDFIGETCKVWEKSVDENIQATRIVKLRTGVVFSKNGGMMEKFALPKKFGIFPILGGKQYLPWIHIEDICAMYLYCLMNEVNGVFNAVAPQHINMLTFMNEFKGKSFGFKIPVPPFFLKIILGEMSNIVLEGSRVSSEKIIKAGFQFRFPTFEKAMKDLIVKS